MRKNLYIIALLAMAMVFPTNAQVTGLSDVRLYIDQGHGDRSNMGIHGYSESENVLRVGLALEEFLLEFTDMRPENIMLSRRTDAGNPALGTRTDQANTFGADFLYSIHSDAGSPTANTTLFLYGGRRTVAGGPILERLPEGGKAFGDFLNADLTSVMRVNRGGNFAPVGTRGNVVDLVFYNAPVTRTIPWLHMLRESNMASHLSEAGFHTNSEQNMQKMNYEWKRLEAYAAFQSMVRFLTAQFGTDGAQEPPQIGIATGFIFDNETDRPINAATITLTENRGGTDYVRTYTTDCFDSLFYRFYSVTRDRELLRNGFYWIEGFTPGATLTAKIEAQGFETVNTTVTIPLTVGSQTSEGLGFLDVAMLNLMPARVINVVARRDLSNNVIQRNPMDIVFDRGMVRASVEQAFSIYPAHNVALSWINDFTLRVDITELDFETDYTITIDGNIARNTITNDLLDGTSDGTPGGNYVFNFRTADLDEDPPVIVSYDPQGNQEESARPIVRIEFDEPLDEATTFGKITVADAYGRAVEGIQSYYATLASFKSVLHFIFEEDLIPEMVYTVTLAAGIEDIHGNAMPSPFSFTFTARPRETNLVAVLHSFDAIAGFWDPDESGSTTGVNSHTSVRSRSTTVVPRTDTPASVHMAYQWLEASPAPVIRWHHPGVVPRFNNSPNEHVQYYLFGDGSNSRISYTVRVGGGGNFFAHQEIIVDWVGWRQISWDITNDPFWQPILGGSDTSVPANVNTSCFWITPAPLGERVFETSGFYFSRLHSVHLGDFIERGNYTINFNVTGVNGTLTADDEIAGAITTGSQVLQGRGVAFTATPNEGFRVKEWTVNETVVVGAIGTTLMLSPTENITVTVEFEVDTRPRHTVTFSVGAGNGTLTATVDGTGITSGAQVLEGANVIFTATPSENYQVKEWTVNGTVVVNETGTTYTLENLTANAAVTVVFEPSTGLGSILGTNISVFPNPFTNIVYIAGAENSLLQVVNVLGTIVYTRQITTADEAVQLGNLPAGIYFFRVERGGQTETIKIVKQ